METLGVGDAETGELLGQLDAATGRRHMVEYERDDSDRMRIVVRRGSGWTYVEPSAASYATIPELATAIRRLTHAALSS